METKLRGNVRAPEFPSRLEWLNVERPVRLAELRGRVVLLDFWTSCCINCHHSLVEVAKLRRQFGDQLAILGVHSAKFPAEKIPASLREAIERHGIAYPVLNDSTLDVWQSYAVKAWPTVVLVDPLGYYLGSQSGEVEAATLGPLIQALIDDFAASGELADGALPFSVPAWRPAGALRYPSKLLATSNGRVFVSDTGNHRVLELAVDAAAERARLVRSIGSGRRGLVDGPAGSAEFDRPQGLVLAGQTLYVADTGNHALRAVDLGEAPGGSSATTGERAAGEATVGTLAGNGSLGRGRARLDLPPRQLALRSPYALALHDGMLYVAMAGQHQIWALDLGGDASCAPYAGSGAEGLVDGPVSTACFSQPSDLAVAMGHLFVVDAEASAVRVVGLNGEPQVHTVVGQGLFDYGDVDGVGPRVRLQHAMGIAARLDRPGERLIVADSYNHKLKELDPTSGRVSTLVGSSIPGFADGALLRAQFNLPDGLSWAGNRLFVADTNNHAVRVVDVERRAVWTLALEGVSPT